TVYRGYYLPWPGGTQIRLTGSIGHFLSYKSCGETSCRYAYDFSNRTMFPLLAAKGGTVWLANWTCPNGATTCNNYIVIRDDTTDPVTYQLYLHMAQNTIPEELRTRGALVSQGQFIGNVDDTGASTGHHLHFMVHTNSNYWWGNSVDVRFQDVPINDGVPRQCIEAKYWPGYGATDCMEGEWYTSGNRDGTGPYLTMPPLPATTNSTVIPLTYGGYDALSGLKSMSLDVADSVGNTANIASGLKTGYYTYLFLGTPGQTYKFTLTATDYLDNKSTMTAQTTVASTCQPDQYESTDNNPTGASYLPFRAATDHNFCGLVDPDWARLDLVAGKEYFIGGASLGGGAAMNLELWSQESQVVARSASAGLAQSTAFTYVPPTSGSYYLRALPLDSRLVGTDMHFRLFFSDANRIFLPMINQNQ
ncbi:MAG TPA: M23 family metallopeptidase, partial [Bellilinea sp.]|nr:M23 family metallopeptidase [Bellilinea sp.]